MNEAEKMDKIDFDEQDIAVRVHSEEQSDPARDVDGNDGGDGGTGDGSDS